MKTTINITLNGTLYSIEDDAYQELKQYLDSIKAYFSDLDDNAEVLADIEAGIAEKFADKINVRKKVITLKDVEEVIKVMGSIKELAEGAEQPVSTAQPYYEEADDNSSFSDRKLYRNPDDKIIAGVCSGLAAYFGLDTVLVRLVFILLIFAGGAGIWIYLILWLITPAAKTSLQKLEMHGKPINLKKIEQAVKEKSKVVKQEGRQVLKKMSKKKGIFYKIISFPVKLAETFFNFFKKLLGYTGPVARIFFGIICLLTAFFPILSLTTVAVFILFNIDSPYIVSDIPLAEFIEQPMYYVGLASTYLVIMIPFIFILLLGFTLLRKRNSFRAVPTGILIGLWTLAIVGTVVAAGDMVPRVNSRIDEINKYQTITKTYDYHDFSKLYLGGNMEVKVEPGNYGITMTGRQQDLDRLSFDIEEGQLQVVQKSRQHDNQICLICFDKPIVTTITMPNLQSLVAFQNARVEVDGFADDLYISLGESARANIDLQDQDLDCKLSGTNSRLTLTGQVDQLTCQLDGSARLLTDDLIINNIELDQDIFSRTELSGKANTLVAKINHHSRLYAFNLETKQVVVNAYDYTRAEVYPLMKIKSVIDDGSRLIYKGRPVEIMIEELGYNKVEHLDFVQLEKPQRNIQGIKIESRDMIEDKEQEDLEDIDTILYYEDNIDSITDNPVLK